MDQWYQNNKEAVSGKRRQRIDRNRNYLIAVKKSNSGCIECGWNGHPETLVFRYITNDNLPSINQMVNNAMSIESIDNALDKCELLCLNCFTSSFYNAWNNP